MGMYEEHVLREEAPDAPGAEAWIKKNKPEFKRRYGSNWARVLYAKAWILYGKNAKNRDDDATAKLEASHITVTISGPVGSGKSGIAQVIQQTLAGGGLDVQYDKDSERGDAEDSCGDLAGVTVPVVLATEYERPRAESAGFAPPQEVREAALRGLALRKAAGRGVLVEHAAGIASGVLRAQSLAAGRELSLDSLRRMRSFFQRHDGELERAARLNESSGANIAWLLWGGDAARGWAEEILTRETRQVGFF